MISTRYLISRCLHRRNLQRQIYSSKATVARAAQVTSSSRLDLLPADAREYVEDKIRLCQPERVHVCDGTDEENSALLQQLVRGGVLSPLNRYQNCYIARTDPADVARVESKTFMSTQDKRTTLAPTADGVKPLLGNWTSPSDLEMMCDERFPGCMKGRTMYVVPFLMGPPGSSLTKVGIELTDSAYVACSMRIMTRMGNIALRELERRGEYVRCLHSVGQPLPMDKAAINNWPCNPEQVMVAHVPDNDEIISYGSGYGGNSLLGKKCLALRLGSVLAQRQGWLAEHMLILGLTNPRGEKRYVAAAFPSACGKTNLAMLMPTLPGWKAECVGDDIAWMKFDKDGQLRAVNPEYGFFGVAPGTSMKTNPNALKTCLRNTLFTNVASTSDGQFYWEGLTDKPPNQTVTDWKNQEWTPNSGRLSSHPNSRFCAPASQCPVIDSNWESPEGVPIDAIIFGGRRPEGVPLVYEALDWEHGVFIGSALRSEATAAAEHKGKEVMHDPFAMRPFFGYNFGHYLQHWLSIQHRQGAKLPKIFHVNWFRKSPEGHFLWPGFGENVRVLDWILRRVRGEKCAVESPIGWLPAPDALDLTGMSGVTDMRQLFDVPKDFWLQETAEIRKFYSDHVGEDLPREINDQLTGLEDRLQR